jgi:hypothetical protein
MGRDGWKSLKTLLWSVWLRTLKSDLMETMELTPNKLKALCEVDWSVLGVGWPQEGSLHKTVANEVYRVIVGNPGHTRQFPYIDWWEDAVLSWPTWLWPCLKRPVELW